MTAREFRPYLERDGGHCYSCGTTEGLVPQHRVNRGMGGRCSLDIPSNIITFCGQCNGRIEADAQAAWGARTNGWKLSDPAWLTKTPVYDRADQQWFFLDEHYGRTVA